MHVGVLVKCFCSLGCTSLDGIFHFSVGEFNIVKISTFSTQLRDRERVVPNDPHF